ncbi:putative uncharacterized protein BRD3OS [Anolis sagrei]|uniref:putative uncharacterized protein BRD3OS n=1 Tax=Anolis sagrei TaxID=38937 RepID=UPI0035201DAC
MRFFSFQRTRGHRLVISWASVRHNGTPQQHPPNFGTTEPIKMSGRPPLAEKALSESYARLRYRDTSLLIWQQQQQKLESLPPGTYLNRSQSMWYSQYGNQAILVRDRNKADVTRDTGQSKFCTVM